MKWIKAILSQPKETECFFWPQLRLQLWKNYYESEVIEDKASYFEIDETFITVYSYGGGGQMDIPKNGPPRLKVALADIELFINKAPTLDELSVKLREKIENEKTYFKNNQ